MEARHVPRPNDSGDTYNGRELAAYRKLNRIPADDVARDMGITSSAVYNIERRPDVGIKTALRFIAGVGEAIRRRDHREGQILASAADDLAAIPPERRVYFLPPITSCRANVSTGRERLRRCGRPVHRGLVVCDRHIEQHEQYLRSAVEALYTRERFGR